ADASGVHSYDAFTADGISEQLPDTPTYSEMTSGSADYLIAGAKSLYGYAVNSYDVAYHYTGPVASSFVVSGTSYSFMTGTNVYGLPYYNEADGFRFNYGVAQNAGLDDAYFYDSAGNDVFSGRTTTSYMYSDNADGTLAEYDSAQGLRQ